MPEPATVPTLYIIGGATIDPTTYTFYQSDGTTPRNLSAYTLDAEWRATRAATSKVDLTVDDTDAATGVVLISGTATDSTTMAGPGVWDLRATLGSEVEYLVTGATSWTQGVTRG